MQLVAAGGPQSDGACSDGSVDDFDDHGDAMDDDDRLPVIAESANPVRGAGNTMTTSANGVANGNASGGRRQGQPHVQQEEEGSERHHLEGTPNPQRSREHCG